MSKLSEWLMSCPGMLSVQDGNLLIFPNIDLLAVRYRQELTPPKGAPNQSKYIRECIYSACEAPKRFLRGKLALPMRNDRREWYVSSYMLKENMEKLDAASRKRYHPFGLSFQISPWDLPEKIDAMEPNPYKRVPAQFVPF